MMLLVTLVVCYLLFLRTQPALNSPRSNTTLTGEPADPRATPALSSEYKQAMDKAHAAARQMQAQRAEADSL